MPTVGEILQALSEGGNGSGFCVYARVGGIDVDITTRALPEVDDGRKKAEDGSMHTAGCAELEYTGTDDTSNRPNSHYKVNCQREKTRHQRWTRDPTPSLVPLIPTEETSDDKPATEEREIKVGQSDLTVNDYPMMYIHVNDRGTEAQTLIGISSTERTIDSYLYGKSDRDSAKVREWLQSNPGDIPPEMRPIMADTVRWYDKANLFSSSHQSGKGSEEADKGEILAKMIAGSFKILPEVDQIKEYFPFMDCWPVPNSSLELLTRRSIGDEQDSSWTSQRRQEQWGETQRDSRTLQAKIPFLLHRIKPVTKDDQAVSYIVVQGRQQYHSHKELNGSTTFNFRGVDLSSWYARTANPDAVQSIPSEIFTTDTTFSPAISELVTQAVKSSQVFIQDVINVRYGNLDPRDSVALAKIGGRERLDRITRIAHRATELGYVWECRNDYAEAFMAAGLRMGVEKVGLEDSVKVARKSMCAHATLNENGFFDEESLQKAILSEAEYQDLKSEIEYQGHKEQGTSPSVK